MPYAARGPLVARPEDNSLRPLLIRYELIALRALFVRSAGYTRRFPKRSRLRSKGIGYRIGGRADGNPLLRELIRRAKTQVLGFASPKVALPQCEAVVKRRQAVS